jgi:peptide/nickel transport system ATP-binding protein
MYAGAIVEEGATADLFAAPRHPYTQGLMDCIPVPGRTLPGARLGAIPGTVPTLVGDVAGCAFRSRCAYAADACAAEPPLQAADGQRWACVRGAA